MAEVTDKKLTTEATEDQTDAAKQQSRIGGRGEAWSQAVAGVQTLAEYFGVTQTVKANYNTFRAISSYPTMALVKAIVFDPIVANSWSWEVTDDTVKNGEMAMNFVKQVMDPLHNSLTRSSLRSLEFGWTPHEKVWKHANISTTNNKKKTDRFLVYHKIKPLMWDYTRAVVDGGGELVGIQNKMPDQKLPTMLGKFKWFAYSYDGECGNPYGRSRHMNLLYKTGSAASIWEQIIATQQRMGQLLKKIASIIACLYYPAGTQLQQAGAPYPTDQIAQSILNAAAEGKSVRFPNLANMSDDPKIRAELAKMSDWHLEYKDSGSALRAMDFVGVFDHWDRLCVRAWHRPERSALESRHGSRADSKQHSDTGLLDSELIDLDLTDAINDQLVDDLLEVNFGEEYRGCVRRVPAKLEGDTFLLYQELLKAILGNPTVGPQVAQKIDVDQLLEDSDVPVVEGNEGELTIPDPTRIPTAADTAEKAD